MRGKTIVMVIATALLASALVPRLVGAHNQSDYYPNKWIQDLNVDWRFTTGFSDGSFRSRAQTGANRWNNLGEPMRFDQLSETPNYNPDSCPFPIQYQRDGIHWVAIDGPGGYLATTPTCLFAEGELATFNIKFDSSEDWYTGTGTPGSNQVDALSVAVHEFGHATGFYGPFAIGHFDPTAGVCTGNPVHTMCPGYVTGSTFLRTLEEHDKHTFGNAY